MDRRARASQVGTLGTPARHAARPRRRRVRRRARRRVPGRRLRRGRSGPDTSAVFSSRRLRDDDDEWTLEIVAVPRGGTTRLLRDVDGTSTGPAGARVVGPVAVRMGSATDRARFSFRLERETSTRRRGPDGSRLVALAAVSSVRRWRWGVPRRAPAADRVGRRGDAARALRPRSS